MDDSIERIVVTGDSISADLTVNVFNEAARRDKFPFLFNTVPDDKAVHLINTGIGGHTAEMIAARFIRDCIELQPDIAVVNGGTNDLWGWNPDDLEFQNSWLMIVNEAQKAKIKLLALNIVPATGFPDEIMHRRDRWNEIIADLMMDHEGMLYVNADEFVGKNRKSGPDGNYWDIKDDCNLDGVHFTTEGSVQIVRSILKSMKHLLYAEE